MTETDYKTVEICVPYLGDEIDVTVKVELETRYWEENHGPGLREPMSETVRVGYDIMSEYPDRHDFIDALETILDVDFPTE